MLCFANDVVASVLDSPKQMTVPVLCNLTTGLLSSRGLETQALILQSISGDQSGLSPKKIVYVLIDFISFLCFLSPVSTMFNVFPPTWSFRTLLIEKELFSFGRLFLL